MKVIEQDGIEKGASCPCMTSTIPERATKVARRENI